jgi:hypothetical protein
MKLLKLLKLFPGGHTRHLDSLTEEDYGFGVRVLEIGDGEGRGGTQSEGCLFFGVKTERASWSFKGKRVAIAYKARPR